jgi:hypothetical protein
LPLPPLPLPPLPLPPLSLLLLLLLLLLRLPAAPRARSCRTAGGSGGVASHCLEWLAAARHATSSSAGRIRAPQPNAPCSSAAPNTASAPARDTTHPKSLQSYADTSGVLV